jgi:peptidoglycan hydrolase-like protein with peptidoglycan-binding domain
LNDAQGKRVTIDTTEMNRLLLLLLVLSISAVARADDQTQAVQQALKDDGFYYGTVDGQPGPETDAAIRRYQIREGLVVTGKLDAPTLSSLNLRGSSRQGSASQSANQPANPPPSGTQNVSPDVVQSDHDILRSQPEPSAAAPPPDASDDQAPSQPFQQQPPAEQPQPPEQQPQPPSEEQPQAPYQQPEPAAPPPQSYVDQALPPQYGKFFKKTPYETAPPVVQRDTVSRAQLRLAREGFYRGMVDGQLSKELNRALAAYQRYAELPQTGRLDLDTLADMNLLPRRQVIAPPPYAGYGPYGPYQPPGVVYRGIWVH